MMMKRRCVLAAVASAGVMSLFVTSCMGPGVDSSAGSDGINDPGVDAATKTITIGGWRVESGPTSTYVLVNHAVDAAYRAAEEAGELNGWKLVLDQPDTAGDPARSLQVIKDQAEQGKVFAINFAVGSAANAQVVPYLGTTEVPYVAPSAAGDQFLDKLYPNVFPLIPAYARMGSSMGVWAAENLDAKRIAVVYQNDSLGQPVGESIDGALETVGANAVLKAPFDTSDVDVSTISQQILAAKPDAVLFWGAGSQLMKAKQQVMTGGVDVPWLTTFFNADESVLDLNGRVAEGMYFQDQYELFTNDTEAVTQFKNAMAKYHPQDPPNGLALSGWAGARTLIEGLKPILESGKPITRQALVDEFNSWRDRRYGVVPGVSFTETERTGITKQYIVRYSAGKFETVTGAEPLLELK
ncbi:ABC transporter substrate-binding protein [Rhodococcus koreensis]